MQQHIENEYLKSLKNSFPVVAGYFTVSFVFGISCVNLGLPIWFPTLMSLLVYAGAAQFSFLILFSTGASISTIVITTFLINLRHMLMSIYISNVFDKLKIKRKFRWLYGYGLTDESFAFHSALDDKNLSHKYFLSFNFFCHSAWVLGTLFGAWLSTKTKASDLVNLQYALTAMMMYVLVLLSTNIIKTIVAIVSIISMIVLSLIYESHFNIFIATFIGTGAGVWLKKKV